MLAKLEADNLTFSPDKLKEASGDSSDIQIVVAEGLQVAVPMAGPLLLHHAFASSSCMKYYDID